MINPFKEINWHPGEKEILSFGKSMLIGFMALALVFLIINLFRGSLSDALPVTLAISTAGILLYLISRLGITVARPFYLLWFFISALIGVVIANLLLALFYYIFFSTFALLFRTISGRDPLTLKKDSNKKTWWVKVPGNKTLKRYFNQY
jgi:uncharacterized protein YacL